jgi:hypothetical protein
VDLQDSNGQAFSKISLNSAADPSDRASAADLVGEPPNDITSASRVAPPSGVVAATDESENGDGVAADAVEADPNAETVEATAETETPKTDEVAPPSSADLMSKLERLAQQDKRLRTERAAVRQAQQEASAKVAEIQKFNEDLQRLRSNPIEAAKFLGIDVRDMIRASLGEEATPKTESELVQEQLAEIKQWRAEQAQREEEAQTQAASRTQQEAINKIYADAESGVRGAGDDFELINAKGDYQRVVDVQFEYYRTHKAPIDWRTAATYVEQAIEKEARLLASTKKIQGAKSPAPAAQKTQTQAVTPQVPRAIPGSRTITTRPAARPTADAPTRIDINTSYLDRDESIERLGAAFAAARRV